MSEAARLDHVGIVGRDLAPLLDAARALGFRPTKPRALLGRDPATDRVVPLGQSSAHLVFGAGYVELSAVHTDSPSHHLAPWLRHGPGLHILAFGTDDVLAAHARCAERGLAPLPLSRACREIAYGERHGQAQFEWFMLAPAATPEALVCFVRQLTPELVFQPAVQRHDNGAVALAGVYAVSDRPGEMAERYAGMTGAALEGHQLRLDGGWVRCMDPAAFAARFPGAGSPRRPSLAGFAVRVPDPGAMGARLAAGGLRGRESPGGIWYGGDEGLGTLVEFLE